MSYSALQNSPILVDLVQAVKDTGWSFSGDIASHESCNTGNIQLTGFTIITGHTYQITYEVLSISGGYVQVFAGTTSGVARTTAGQYTETITAAGVSPILYFRSNATCQIRAFNIQDTAQNNTQLQYNTIVYVPSINKWTSFYTMSPDYGFSMFIRTLLFKGGILYKQENGSDDRNNLFGVQYDSIVAIVGNKIPEFIHTYQSLSIQSNRLLVTTTDGITTSLGQISQLSEIDFCKDVLTDGDSSVAVFSKEGVYSAGFLRDSQVDLLNGDVLKGNYIIIYLTTIDSDPVSLYSVNIISEHSNIGAR